MTYLDKEAVEATLRKIASTAKGSVVAFDYFTTEPQQIRMFDVASFPCYNNTRLSSRPTVLGCVPLIRPGRESSKRLRGVAQPG